MNANLRNFLLVALVTTAIALYNYYSDPKNQKKDVTEELIPGLPPEASMVDSNRADTTMLSAELENYKQQLVTKQMTGPKDEEADLLCKVANICARQNKTDEALEHYKKALEIITPYDNKTKTADLCYTIAIVYRDANQPEKALDYFMQASSMYTQAGDKVTADSCLQKINRLQYSVK